MSAGILDLHNATMPIFGHAHVQMLHNITLHLHVAE